MKKKFVLSIFAVIAGLATALGCLSACKPNMEDSTSSVPTDSSSMDITYSGDWELSGNISDYYFVSATDNVLSQEFQAETMRVSAGELVAVTSPIVIDGVGNCLGVEYSVRTKETKTSIAVVSGGFFAMAAEGYEIVYFVSTLDGKKHEFTQTVEVSGADQLYTDGNITVELKGYASTKETRLIALEKNAYVYDLKDLMTDEQKAVLAENENKGTVSWRLLPTNGAEIALETSTVDFAEVEKAYYIVVAELIQSGANTVFFVDTVDFYAPDEGVVWNTVTDDTQKVSLYNCTDNTQLSVVDQAKDRSGKYYQVVTGDKTGEAEPFAFMFQPLHSKEYYAMYALENYKLSFVFYLDAELEGKEVLGVFGTVKGELNGVELYVRRQFKAGQWNSVMLSLNDYLKVWESMASFEALYYVTGASTNVQRCTAYFGEFTLQSSIEIAEGEEKLVEISNLQTYNLESLMTEEQLATLDVYKQQGDIEWALISATGAETTYDEAEIDLSTLPTMSYTVLAKLKLVSRKQTVFVGAVDFYDETKGLEWSTIGENSCVVKEYGASGGIESGVVDITETDIADGRTGDYYMVRKADEATTTKTIFTLMPIHSKAYYELYADEMAKYTLSYDIYMSATGTNADGEAVDITKVGGTVAKDDGYAYHETGEYYYFTGVQITNNAWTTYSITLDKLYGLWDEYVSSNARINIYTTNNVFYYGNTYTNSGAYTYYLGNLKVDVNEAADPNGGENDQDDPFEGV